LGNSQEVGLATYPSLRTVHRRLPTWKQCEPAGISGSARLYQNLGAFYLSEKSGRLDRRRPCFLEREDPELEKERSEERQGLEEGNRGDLVYQVGPEPLFRLPC